MEFAVFPNMFSQQIFINSDFKNVTYTLNCRTRENHETINQEIDKRESDLLLMRKAKWKIVSEQNVLHSVQVLRNFDHKWKGVEKVAHQFLFHNLNEMFDLSNSKLDLPSNFREVKLKNCYTPRFWLQFLKSFLHFENCITIKHICEYKRVQI